MADAVATLLTRGPDYKVVPRRPERSLLDDTCSVASVEYLHEQSSRSPSKAAEERALTPFVSVRPSRPSGQGRRPDETASLQDRSKASEAFKGSGLAILKGNETADTIRRPGSLPWIENLEAPVRKGCYLWRLSHPDSHSSHGRAPYKPVQERVQVPRGVDREDWLAAFALRFHEDISQFSAVVTKLEICTAHSCPVMCAGTWANFRWRDRDSTEKPKSVSAPDYQRALLADTFMVLKELLANGRAPYPSSFRLAMRYMFRRYARVYMHLYLHHFDAIRRRRFDSDLVDSFRLFVHFIAELNLVSDEHLAPVQQIVDYLRQKQQGSPLENSEAQDETSSDTSPTFKSSPGSRKKGGAAPQQDLLGFSGSRFKGRHGRRVDTENMDGRVDGRQGPGFPEGKQDPPHGSQQKTVRRRSSLLGRAAQSTQVKNVASQQGRDRQKARSSRSPLDEWDVPVHTGGNSDDSSFDSDSSGSDASP
eukprot:TRINITY_DN31970_c0_g1_i1.p1 TRINITY_DN31970_c0_g1~~TRINITY_DN31970_c0_g1_i1.p1  ORF type:complete len:478 (+),score=79.58 TRINITY_DN31970_c0_g1_i1:111-1544(+)